MFSKGYLILSHTRSRLSVETTRALLCLNSWYSLELVDRSIIADVTLMPDIKEDVEEVEHNEKRTETNVFGGVLWLFDVSDSFVGLYSFHGF